MHYSGGSSFWLYEALTNVMALYLSLILHSRTPGNLDFSYVKSYVALLISIENKKVNYFTLYLQIYTFKTPPNRQILI